MMKPVLALLILCGWLVGCGGGSSTATTLQVTCGGSLSLAGAKSIDVISAAGTGATLSYPDPANPGHTGTIAIKPGTQCTIAPTSNV
jgi:hypothetical protein